MTDTRTAAGRTTAPRRPRVLRSLLRLVGAFAVGSVVAPVIAFAAVAVAFGGVAVGAAVFVVATGCGALLMAVVHQTTHLEPRRPGLARSVGWGVAVLLGSVIVIGCAAATWEQSDREFGSSPTLWWLLSGLAVALVASLTARGTALPGTVVSVALACGAVAVLGVPDVARSGAAEEKPTSGLSRALIHVTSPSGYDDGQITTDSPGSTIIYSPTDGPAVGAGPDRMILLTSQAPAPAECGRPQTLPFDTLDAAKCEALAPDVFYRSTGRYHEVVVVSPTVVITASGSIDVPEHLLRAAATTARPATDAEVERLYKGWDLDP